AGRAPAGAAAMSLAATTLRWLIRLLAVAQVGLGLAFWSANLLGLIPLHMALGALLVLSLWAMAGLAGLARVSPAPVALAIAWGALVLWLGLNQSAILPGDWHW